MPTLAQSLNSGAFLLIDYFLLLENAVYPDKLPIRYAEDYGDGDS